MLLLLFCLDPVTETTEKLAEPPAHIASFCLSDRRALAQPTADELSFNSGYSVVLKVETFQ